MTASMVMPSAPPPPPPPPFDTMLDLRATHRTLLQRQRAGEPLTAISNDVLLFVGRARATGAILDVDDHRDAVQGLIDYWCTTLYRLDIKIPGTDLQEFDIAAAPTLADHLCPYVGLASFDEQTADRFFGRDQMLREIRQRLAEDRFLAVLGPSGSGKSSIVLAGILPMLRCGGVEGSRDWRFLPPIVPGSDPLANLDSLLDDEPDLIAELRRDETTLVRVLGDGQPAVIVVDQLEEIFTLCEDDALRDAFVANLTTLAEAPSPKHRLFVTMRSDYEPRLNRYPRLQKLVEKGLLRATPLSAAELRESIEKPAERIGLKLDAGLIDEMVNDVLGEPAALPLLQFAMLRLWQDRDHNRITLDAYRRLGNSRVALGRAADALYEQLLPEDQVIMRKILMRMVRPAAGEETTRRRIRVAELEKIGHAPANVMRVLDKLLAARLVRESGCETDPQVEVAHEALIRNWPRFGNWLEERRAELLHGRRLEALAEEWERYGRESGFLDPAQIVDAEQWMASEEAAELGVHESLRALVTASRELHEETARRHRRTKRLAIGIAVGVVVLLFGILWRAYEAVSAENRKNRKLMTDLQTKITELERTKEALVTEKKNATSAVWQVSAAYMPSPAPAVVPTVNVEPPEDIGLLTPSKKLRSGVSIGTGNRAGSACCLVQDEKGQRYLLTMAQVFADSTPGDPVFQPGGSNESTRIGVLARVGSNTVMSGALVKLDRGVTLDASIPKYGRIRGLAAKIRDGDQVRAVGRGSGFSLGAILAGRGNDYVTTINSTSGDTGAPVVNSRNELIGVIYAGKDDVSYVLPIEPILKELGVTLVSGK